MLFTSPIFLYIFLPLTLLCYYLTPKKGKNTILLLSSLFFYAWGEKHLVGLIILSAIIDFCCGLIIEKKNRKLGLTLSICFNLSLLLYFKYSGFIFNNICNTLNIPYNHWFATIILPLGISFYTFQTMSYSIDVYRGKIRATTNFVNFLTYVSLFPQLIAGPIVRYSEVETELKNRKTTSSLFYKGIERFVIGLAKKLIIANNIAFLADGIFAMPNDEKSLLIAWLGLIAYGLQIYFDFSGYSDMAIGLGKMFGFNFPENFNTPYLSKSVQEFWRRWHMTLSNWFKDYVYISLGGNRLSLKRTYINLSIVFFITGFWHGANWTFICWGLCHGFFLILERVFLAKILKKTPKLLTHLYLILTVFCSWVLFRSESLPDAINYYQALLLNSVPTNYDYLNYYLTNESKLALLLAVLISFNIYPKLKSNTKWYLKPICILALFILCQFYVASDSYNPFIYFRF